MARLPVIRGGVPDLADDFQGCRFADRCPLADAACRHAEPAAVWPVRVRAGAFAEGVPCRDVWLSPDHAVFADGVLIAAKHLVNGVTVVRDLGFALVRYFHVELARHDVMIAEGLAVETYLDTGNRGIFDNAVRAA